MKWEIVSQREMDSSETIKNCTNNGNWIGFCLFIQGDAENIRAENTSGCLGYLNRGNWMQLGKLGDLEYIEYNDSINYACYVKIEDGELMEYYLFDEEGHEKIESGELYKSWMDVANVLDEDDDVNFDGSGFAVMLKTT